MRPAARTPPQHRTPPAAPAAHPGAPTDAQCDCAFGFAVALPTRRRPPLRPQCRRLARACSTFGACVFVACGHGHSGVHAASRGAHRDAQRCTVCAAAHVELWLIADIPTSVSTQDGSEGVSTQDGSEGVSTQDGSEGVSTQDGSEGVSTQDGSEGVSTQEGSEGAVRTHRRVCGGAQVRAAVQRGRVRGVPLAQGQHVRRVRDRCLPEQTLAPFGPDGQSRYVHPRYPGFALVVPLFIFAVPLFALAVPLFALAVPLFALAVPLLILAVLLFALAVPLFALAVPAFGFSVPFLWLNSTTNNGRATNPPPRATQRNAAQRSLSQMLVRSRPSPQPTRVGSHGARLAHMASAPHGAAGARTGRRRRSPGMQRACMRACVRACVRACMQPCGAGRAWCSVRAS